MVHPILMNDLVVDTIQGFVSIDEYPFTKIVCKAWNTPTRKLDPIKDKKTIEYYEKCSDDCADTFCWVCVKKYDMRDGPHKSYDRPHLSIKYYSISQLEEIFKNSSKKLKNLILTKLINSQNLVEDLDKYIPFIKKHKEDMGMILNYSIWGNVSSYIRFLSYGIKPDEDTVSAAISRGDTQIFDVFSKGKQFSVKEFVSMISNGSDDVNMFEHVIKHLGCRCGLKEELVKLRYICIEQDYNELYKHLSRNYLDYEKTCGREDCDNDQCELNKHIHMMVNDNAINCFLSMEEGFGFDLSVNDLNWIVNSHGSVGEIQKYLADKLGVDLSDFDDSDIEDEN